MHTYGDWPRVQFRVDRGYRTGSKGQDGGRVRVLDERTEEALD